MQFNESGNQSFHCGVKVPEDALAGQYTLGIGGTYQMSPGAPLTYQIQASQSMIDVKQNFKISASPKPQSLQLNSGSSAMAEIEVLNLGNGNDLVDMTATKGEQELKNAGFSVIVNPSQLEIAPNSTGNFSIGITFNKPTSDNSQIALEFLLTSMTMQAQGSTSYQEKVVLNIKIGKGSQASNTGNDDDTTGGSGHESGNSTSDDIPIETIYLSDLCCEAVGSIIVLIIIVIVIIIIVKVRRGSSYSSGYHRSSYDDDHGLLGHSHRYHSYNSHHSSSSGRSSSHRGLSGPHTHEIKLFRR